MTFELLSQVAYPSLGFEGGDRMVGVQLWDVAENDDRHRGPFDYSRMQKSVTALDALGAFSSIGRNLILPDRGAHLVSGA